MNKEKNHKSALSVNMGVERPPSVNPDGREAFRSRRKRRISPDRLRDGILEGNISLLSQAITLIESSLPMHQEAASELVEKCLPYSGKSIRIGITGVPGVGKSTFIESFGKLFTNTGRKLAVLAIDPSSERSKGSILGDKTRMEELSSDPNAFIRPSPSCGSLGGIAGKTRESIILCEAAGFDTIFVETVGVGQSETSVHSMVDFFLLLMLAGAGDELQGIKRGIMEMADMIAITKADGKNVSAAGLAKTQYQGALHLYPPSPSGWVPRVLTCSSVNGEGLDEVHSTLMEYFGMVRKSGYFEKNRKGQDLYWMYEKIDQKLKESFYSNKNILAELENVRNELRDGKISSFNAAKKMLDRYFHKPGTDF
ncbi:MAG: methylmalonyl Co-A mutase-associated GTPase MeaB [Bacteroidales bacterium]